ncbi:MAG: hypothetical protein ACTSX1_08700 [Candidatus Heimdallarchaeaceae archaeon]
MTFKGFEVQYPEYEVLTPQTKQSYTLRSLSVQEEENLKGSLITPAKIAEHLNKCIFTTLISKPKEVDNLDAFLRTTTLKDRDALLYGLYHITYEEIRNYQVKCTSCATEYPVTVQASSTFNFNPYPGENILGDKKRVELPISKGVFATVRQPTLLDEMHSIGQLSNRPGSTIELITETLIIEQFEQDITEKKEPIVYSDRIDVIDAYLSLPARDKRAIYKAYEDAFGVYGVELKMQSQCTSCGNQDNYDIDLVESFFRALFSA